METEAGRNPGPDHHLSGGAGDALSRARPFAVAVGEQLRATREVAGLTAQDVARKARRLGLSWHRPTVGQIEQGKRNISAAELFLLPLVYGKPLHDLLPPEEGATWLTSEVAVFGGELRRVLSEGYNPGDAEYDAEAGTWQFRNSAQRMREVSERMRQEVARFPHGPIGHIAAPDEAEVKAAKRLETTPEYVAYSARELWGRGLAAERDARLAERPDPPTAPRAVQAARGHITRTLLDELGPTVREHEKRRDQPRPRYRAVKAGAGVRVVRVDQDGGERG